MYNFTIGFEHPWLLLLIIPALFFTLLHYFLSAKKYRRNRNRITSMVLHMLVMVLAISVLSGVAFLYDVPNTDNQVVLLVDMSDSSENAAQRRDEAVADILSESRSQYSMGVVLFGYDQVLASPLTTDAQSAYRRYESAPLPDVTATDIASALRYARTLFTSPETAKIVVISDGLETDGDALSAVRSIAADGIRVDSVSLTLPRTDEVEIADITVPDYNVIVGDEFSMTVRVRSSVGTNEEPVEAVMTVYDNGEAALEGAVRLTGGEQDIVVQYEFDAPGLHTMSVGIANEADTLTQNNTYHTYINIAVFDRILVLERNNGESDEVVSILREGTDYTVNVLNILTQRDALPKTVNELRAYDEVVLVNIANADMPEGFDELLNSYVYTYGGGLFTVGGDKEEGGELVANAYDRADMEGTLYQQMLPVQAIDYTPPLGVIFLLDVSMSMFQGTVASGKSLFELGKEAIASCVRYSLSERDYCGVMTLGDPAVEISPVVPVPRMATVLSALAQVDERWTSLSGTPYATSVLAAGRALQTLNNIEKRHIVIVSDGGPTDDGGYDEYSKVIETYAALGVTTTIVNIGNDDTYDADLTNAAALGGGRYIKISDIQTLTSEMRKELESEEITGVNYAEFTPVIREHTSVVSGISQDAMPKLHGFYGTKLKADATAVLVGEYVPIYAQWKYGEGSVGSFMCDLSGTWSGREPKWSTEFVTSETGRQLVRNIAVALFPSRDIRPSQIDISLACGNYSTVMSVYTDLAEGERIEASYTNASGTVSAATPIEMDPSNGYTRATFVITEPGVHRVTVRKMDENGNVLASSSQYRVFSYSAEYEVLTDRDGAAFMSELATKGNGTSVTEAWQVFEGFERLLHMRYDPRLAFCAAAIVLFLLDIAVRKFKFKWLHEIVRERRERRTRASSGGREGA